MKIVFMGTPAAAAASLDRILRDGHEIAAVYTQPDKASGRGMKGGVSAVKEFALSHGLPVVQPVKVKTPEALVEFRAFDADAAVVVAYGRILPETWLAAFPLGAINVHFSLLPKYRGAAPVNWAIVQGEKETGVTTMQMDVGLDTGPMLLQRATPIGERETAVELMGRLAVIGADLLAETLSGYREITPQPQDETKASYAPIMKKEDGLISWMLSAREITDRVRGFQPFPTAFTYYQGKKLTLHGCEPAEISHAISEVGTIIEAKGDDLFVFCGGDSVLRIDKLQLEGRRAMATRDFLNGNQLHAGDKLGI